jgi:hypothetical protein
LQQHQQERKQFSSHIAQDRTGRQPGQRQADPVESFAKSKLIGRIVRHEQAYFLRGVDDPIVQHPPGASGGKIHFLSWIPQAIAGDRVIGCCRL